MEIDQLLPSIKFTELRIDSQNSRIRALGTSTSDSNAFITQSLRVVDT